MIMRFNRTPSNQGAGLNRGLSKSKREKIAMKSNILDRAITMLEDDFKIRKASLRHTHDELTGFMAAIATLRHAKDSLLAPEEPKTKVVFRKWRKREGEGIIALFPEIPADLSGYLCQSYQHVGQHGAASYDKLVSVQNAPTVPATPEEYADLKEELESIGYVLEVRRRCTPAMRKALSAEIKAMRGTAKAD